MLFLDFEIRKLHGVQLALAKQEQLRGILVQHGFVHFDAKNTRIKDGIEIGPKHYFDSPVRSVEEHSRIVWDKIRMPDARQLPMDLHGGWLARFRIEKLEFLLPQSTPILSFSGTGVGEGNDGQGTALYRRGPVQGGRLAGMNGVGLQLLGLATR